MSVPAAVLQPGADPTESRFRLRAAYGLVTGCLLFYLGLAWDVQWHSDVGPDTFWTAPHLAMYGGVAVIGLVSACVVLLTTLRYRKGAPGVTAANTTPWMGLFRAPLGFVVAGMGAVCFLLMGAFDFYWHDLYGFDVTLWSPPHIGLLLGGVISMIGPMYAFASAVNLGGGKLLSAAGFGFAASVAVFMAMGTVFVAPALDLKPYAGPYQLYGILSGALYIMGLMAAASAVRRPGTALLAALFFTLIRALIWHGVPAAVEWEAALEGLPMRGRRYGIAIAAFLMPAYLAAAGALVDGALWSARRLKLPASPSILAIGAAAALVSHLLYQPLPRLLGLSPVGSGTRSAIRLGLSQPQLPTLLAIAAAGAACGWAGWRLAAALRHTDR